MWRGGRLQFKKMTKYKTITGSEFGRICNDDFDNLKRFIEEDLSKLPFKIKIMRGKNRIPVDNSEIVKCLRKGLLPKQIAPALKMNYRTVIDRIQKMKKDNDCQTLYQLIAMLKDPETA
jgi:hypothetical protein